MRRRAKKPLKKNPYLNTKQAHILYSLQKKYTTADIFELGNQSDYLRIVEVFLRRGVDIYGSEAGYAWIEFGEGKWQSLEGWTDDALFDALKQYFVLD